MKISGLLLFVIIYIATLQGCNSIYLYETEKYSLTIEGRPDASSPVSFNFGAKERIASVIPSKNTDTNANNCIVQEGAAPTNQTKQKKILKQGEALSLISYFNLNKKDKVGWLNDPITVETALLTGKVASCIGEADVPKMLLAMVPNRSAQNPGADYSIMRNIVRSLKNDNQQLNALNGLAIAVIPKTYPVPIFEMDDINKSIMIATKKDSSTGAITIDSAIDYWGDIDDSVKILKLILKTPNGYKINEAPVDDEIVQIGLQSEYDKSKLELERINKELAGNPVYINAVQFYIDKYLKQAKSGN